MAGIPHLPPRIAFTLLEVMIAVGILGVGLIMVASVFPVALAQHKETTDFAAAQQLVSRARGILTSKIIPNQLFIPPENDVPIGTAQDPNLLLPGAPASKAWPIDCRWFPLPAEILTVATPQPASGRWLGWPNNVDTATAFYYFNRLAGFSWGDVNSPFLPLGDMTRAMISRRDMLLDDPPPNDVDRVPASRYVWYGFYGTGQRQPTVGFPPTGARVPDAPIRSGAQYAIAVCRAGSQQVFALQDLESPNQLNVLPTRDQRSAYWEVFNRPTSYVNGTIAFLSRFPVPWRVEVKRFAEPSGVPPDLQRNNSARRVLSVVPMLGGPFWTLAELAPAGTKMLNAETGQVYTVARSVDAIADPAGFEESVEIAEDESTLPIRYDTLLTGSDTARFHVYLFPPAVIANVSAGGAVTNALFTKEPPVIDFFFF